MGLFKKLAKVTLVAGLIGGPVAYFYALPKSDELHRRNAIRMLGDSAKPGDRVMVPLIFGREVVMQITDRHAVQVTNALGQQIEKTSTTADFYKTTKDAAGVPISADPKPFTTLTEVVPWAFHPATAGPSPHHPTTAPSPHPATATVATPYTTIVPATYTVIVPSPYPYVVVRRPAARIIIIAPPKHHK